MLISAFTNALLKSQVVFVNINALWLTWTMNDCMFININKD